LIASLVLVMTYVRPAFATDEKRMTVGIAASAPALRRVSVSKSQPQAHHN
jgi:hypothetical protein